MPHRAPRRVAIVLATLLVPAAAHAGNRNKPRAPVDWEGAPCMVVVDRAVDPVVHVPYAIPYEDPEPGEELGPDEVADSRRHQFFAFSREPEPLVALPNWITQADVDAYTAIDPEFDPASIGVEDMLESSAEWTDTWVRLTADDDRRPISFVVARMGFDWDTSALPAGTWHVEGFTWEPPLDLWTKRSGVFKLQDGTDPTQHGPAVALTPIVITIDVGESVMIPGCIDAMDGTTISADWSVAEIGSPLAWTEFATDLPVTTGGFDLEFVAPAELGNGVGAIRVRASDPMRRSYVTYLDTPVTVVGEPECEETGSFLPPPECADEGSSGAPGSGGTTGTAGGTTVDATSSQGTAGEGTTAPQEGGSTPGGCGCGSTGGAARLVGILLLGLRRRRASPRAC